MVHFPDVPPDPLIVARRTWSEICACEASTTVKIVSHFSHFYMTLSSGRPLKQAAPRFIIPAGGKHCMPARTIGVDRPWKRFGLSGNVLRSRSF